MRIQLARQFAKDFELLMISWRSTIWQCNMVFQRQATTSSIGSCGTTKQNKRKTCPARKSLCCQTRLSPSPRGHILVAGSLLNMQTRDRSPFTSATRKKAGSWLASREQRHKREKATRGFSAREGCASQIG